MYVICTCFLFCAFVTSIFFETDYSIFFLLTASRGKASHSFSEENSSIVLPAEFHLQLHKKFRRFFACDSMSKYLPNEHEHRPNVFEDPLGEVQDI